MNQKYFIVFILIITSLKLNAQTSSFDISADYFSNTSTFGQVNLLEKQPSSSIALNYTLKNSLNAGLSTAYIGNSDTSLSTGTFEYDIMIGYSVKINKLLSLYTHYNYILYSKNANTLLTGYHHDIGLDAEINFKKYSTGILTNYLVGNEKDLFFGWQHYMSFSKAHLLFKSDIAFFDPEIDFNFGNQTYYNNYFWENYQNNPQFQQNLLNRKRFQQKINSIMNKNPNMTEDQAVYLISQLNLQEEKEFNLSSISLYMPISYLYKNMMFSLGFNVILLTNRPEYIDEKFQYYINTGIIFSFTDK